MRRLLLLVLFFVASSVAAQTDTSGDAWEIIERCVDEPTTPPEKKFY